MAPDPEIRIGTSGWNYDAWKGSFYPGETPASRFLETYAETFSSVEVNGTFYRLPEVDTVHEWVRSVPDSFVFSVKASRFITHMKKLRDPEEPLVRLEEVLDAFGEKLGPVLFQLPPKWTVNAGRLGEFLERLSLDFRYTFEFRDRSWHTDEVYRLLRENNVAWCVYDLEGRQSPEETTADFVYVRLHGPNRQAYTGSYPGQSIAKWARRCRKWRDEGRAVYCYFDNDEKAHAPDNAKRLRERVGKQDA